MSMINLIGILTIVLVIVSILFELSYNIEAFAQPKSDNNYVSKTYLNSLMNIVQKQFNKMTEKLDKIDYRVKVMENEINQDFDYEKDQI